MSEDGDGGERERRASDVPLDLVKERESFVRSFLQKGVEYTEQLLQENKELRDELHSLREDNLRLRAQVASDDAIRDLLRTVERLEDDRQSLMRQTDELEAKREEHEGRQHEIEQELNDLANLYIASYQLHASLSVRRVVRHLRDLVGQLVGAEGFVIYVLDRSGKTATPIAHEQVDESLVEPIGIGVGPVGDACLTGIPRIREHEPIGQGTFDDPVAVIPLIAEGKAVGAISVITLLSQKAGWASVDRELFKLLGAHAGAALIAANLYAGCEGPLEALRELDDKL